MIMRIVVGIIAGGFLGFVSSLFIANALGAPDSVAVNAIYFGVVSGLLVCLIMEVHELKHPKKYDD